MATTTTNYGFDVPTSSDLVKNGATAISTLGQDLDTFLFRPFSRNAVLNSSFNIWQRGTTASNPNTIASTYIADRWSFYRPAGFTTGITMSRQTTSDTTNLPFIQYCARIQRTASNTSTTQLFLAQNFESVNSIPFAGKTVTFSFYARAGANFSAASSILNGSIITGTGTDQNIINGLTTETIAFNTNATLTTTWQRFTVTGSVGSSVTQIVPFFQYTPVGTAGANDYFEVTGVMVEVGNQVSPYTPATPTYATELAACQRYYYRNTGGGAFFSVGHFAGTTANAAEGHMKLPVSMRVAPTGITVSGSFVVAGGSILPTVTFDANTTSKDFLGLTITSTSNFAQYRACHLISYNNAANYIETTGTEL